MELKQYQGALEAILFAHGEPIGTDRLAQALEVLSVIAYNQPVSRSFIDQVRGVDSSSVVAGLLEKGLVQEAGRLDLPGHPVSFATTDVFLRCFGLNSLNDLPSLHGEDGPGAASDTEG